MERGHKLRLAIQAWVADNPGSRMADIIQAFKQCSQTNVRHNVIRMCKEGMLAKNGSWGQQCSYSISPIEQEEPEEAKPVNLEQVTGGRTVYVSGSNPAIAKYRSGGQGSVVKAEIGSGMYGGTW